MTLPKEIDRYLKETLGTVASEVQPCANAALLPYYLQEAFAYGQMTLAKQPIVLVMKKPAVQQPLRDVRLQMTRIAEALGLPVVYCLPTLASYERRNLIEQKVPFIVPGNQMYLPELGIDLREHFRQSSPQPRERFSPSTQALLIRHLINSQAQVEWFPAADVSALGYTPMTTSRAIRELVQAGLAEPMTAGRSKGLRMAQTRQAIWQKSLPLLRSPVKRSLWVRGLPLLASSDVRLAGLSGLSEQTMLAHPREPIVAMTAQQWQQAAEQGVQEVPGPETGACQLEVWTYSPALKADTQTVDPLSLWLSLKDHSDDRVQMALSELLEQIQW